MSIGSWFDELKIAKIAENSALKNAPPDRGNFQQCQIAMRFFGKASIEHHCGTSQVETLSCLDDASMQSYLLAFLAQNLEIIGHTQNDSSNESFSQDPLDYILFLQFATNPQFASWLRLLMIGANMMEETQPFALRTIPPVLNDGTHHQEALNNIAYSNNDIRRRA